ncbi:hypothetical protein V6N13_126883 [Hibiscus sabdariffa]
MGLKLAGALDFIAIVPRTSSWPSNHHCNHYCFENMSEKTVAMNVVAIMDSSSYLTQRQSQSGSSNVPSYMSPTQSVKAKVGSQGPVKKQNGPSGGGTTVYQAPRSSDSKGNGAQLPSRRLGGCSPNTGEGWRLTIGSNGR